MRNQEADDGAAFDIQHTVFQLQSVTRIIPHISFVTKNSGQRTKVQHVYRQPSEFFVNIQDGADVFDLHQKSPPRLRINFLFIKKHDWMNVKIISPFSLKEVK